MDQTQQHYDAKATFKQERRNAPIEEKLLALWRLQQLYVDLVGSQRPLQPWQQPWDIRSDVREQPDVG